MGICTVIKRLGGKLHSLFREPEPKSPQYTLTNSTVGRGCSFADTVSVVNSRVGDYVRIFAGTSLVNASIGDCSYISHNTKLSHADIGKFCSLSANIRNRLGNHPSRDFVTTHPAFFSTMGQSGVVFADKSYFPEYGGRVTIGNDVWIGYGVLIMDDVTIHSGAIVGAGAVVTKDVPPYAVVGGIPARVIRYRFSPENIGRLLDFAWWDKDIEWIRENYMLFHDIQKFSRAFFL